MKSTRWKKVGIILAVLLVIVIAAALIVPSFIDLNRYNGFITSKIEAATGGEVTLGPLDWGISNGVWVEVDGFTLKGATSFPGEVDLPRIYAKVSVIPLLFEKVVVDELLLQNPFFEVNLGSSPNQKKKVKTEPVGTPSTGGQTAVSADKANSPLPVNILVKELTIEKGRMKLEKLPGQQVSRVFGDVDIEAKNLAPGKHTGFQFALQDESKPGLGSLRGQGTFSGLTEALTLENPRLTLKATLSGLEVESFKPYMKDKSLAERLGGSMSLEVAYEGDLGKHFDVDGNMDLSRFTYTDLSKWEKPLPGAETKITYELVFDSDQIQVKKFDLSLGSISLKGQGLVGDWRKEPTFENGVFSANVPLAEVLPLVPWKIVGKSEEIIRQALAGGGKVTIDKLVLPELALTKLPSKPGSLLSKIEGSARISDVSGVPTATYRVREGNGTIELVGDKVNLKDFTLVVNDQKMTGSGQITDFEEPTAQLQVKSPNLNLDRLLPPAAPQESSSKKPSSKPSGKQEGNPKSTGAPSEKTAKKGELNPFLRKLTAELQLDAARGQYRGQEFQALKLKALYERGLLKSHDLEVRIGGGHIHSQGTADLRRFQEIPFTLEPTIEGVALESMAPLLGMNKASVKGPLNLSGQVQGSTGNTLHLLRSLRGNVEGELGPGRIYKLGNTGNVFFKLLDFLSLRNILSGKKLKDLGSEGVPYESIKAKTSLLGGKMNISQLALESPALEMDANGDIDLVKKRLNMNADIAMLGTLDKILGLIPIAGEAGTGLTRIYVAFEGDLQNPKIRIRPLKGVTEAGKKGVQEGGKSTEDVIKEFGKGLDKILGK